MKKMLLVAQREFLATAGTRAFIFGVLVTPLMMTLLIFLMPRLMRQGPPMVMGEIAIVDPTGQVAPGVAAFLKPDRIAQRRQEAYRKMQEAMPPALRAAAGGKAKANEGIERAFESALGEVPRLTIVPLQSAVSGFVQLRLTCWVPAVAVKPVTAAGGVVSAARAASDASPQWSGIFDGYPLVDGSFHAYTVV